MTGQQSRKAHFGTINDVLKIEENRFWKIDSGKSMLRPEIIVATFCLFLATQNCLADSLAGELNFTKSLPFVGILYFKDNSGSPNANSIDQKNKIFGHRLVPVSKDGALNFVNSDDYAHNIFANDIKKGIKFDVGLMPPGHNLSLKVDWQEDILLRVGCKIHPKMRAYVANISSRAYQIFNFEKRINTFPVAINNIDPELTRATLLLPKYDPIEIDITTGQTVTVDITKRGKIKGTLTLTRD